MKKRFFLLILLLSSNFIFATPENKVIDILKSDSLTENIFNDSNKKYCIQQIQEIDNLNSLVVLSEAKISLFNKYKEYSYLNNIYILDNSIIKFFNESFYINDSDISENFLKQIENVQLMNSTAIYADLTYNGQNDLFIFRGDSIAFYTLIISLNDFLNTTEIFHSLEIDNGCVKSIDIGKIFGKNIAFCIINNKRGFKVPYLYKNNQMLEQFYYWSPKEQKYILDKSVTQEQIQNAYCPEDYFAYNGLKFSKLDSKLTDEDLKGLDKAQLRLMRNAVYARHGRTFKSVDLQSLWECYNWYEKNPNYSDDLLTEVDKYNIELIQKYEK